MSILVRPVREQLEHDRVIRLLQEKWKRRFLVEANVGDERSASLKVGQAVHFPDLVFTSMQPPRRIQGIVEVETLESVNDLEASYQWANFGKARAPFFLYVPVSAIDAARRLVAARQVSVAELWSYVTLGEQIHFNLVERHWTPPAGMSSEQVHAAPTPPGIGRPSRPRPAVEEAAAATGETIGSSAGSAPSSVPAPTRTTAGTTGAKKATGAATAIAETKAIGATKATKGAAPAKATTEAKATAATRATAATKAAAAPKAAAATKPAAATAAATAAKAAGATRGGKPTTAAKPTKAVKPTKAAKPSKVGRPGGAVHAARPAKSVVKKPAARKATAAATARRKPAALKKPARPPKARSAAKKTTPAARASKKR